MSEKEKDLLKNIGAAVFFFFFALGCVYLFASTLADLIGARIVQ